MYPWVVGWVGLHCCEHVLLALVDDRRTEACAEAERSGGAASAAMELGSCGGASWSEWCSIPVSQRPSSQRLNACLSQMRQAGMQQPRARFADWSWVVDTVDTVGASQSACKPGPDRG